MFAYLVLLAAVLSRVLPQLAHVTGANVTLAGAGLLFFGSRLAPNRRWQAFVAMAAFAATDVFLTLSYGYRFELRDYVLTWAWYAAVVLAASVWITRKHGVARVAVAAVASSTSFFLLSNGAVWAAGRMYTKDLHGLLECYAAGVPFYRNDLASTLVFSVLLFGAAWAVDGAESANRSESVIAKI